MVQLLKVFNAVELYSWSRLKWTIQTQLALYPYDAYDW